MTYRLGFHPDSLAQWRQAGCDCERVVQGEIGRKLAASACFRGTAGRSTGSIQDQAAQCRVPPGLRSVGCRVADCCGRGWQARAQRGISCGGETLTAFAIRRFGIRSVPAFFRRERAESADLDSRSQTVRVMEPWARKRWTWLPTENVSQGASVYYKPRPREAPWRRPNGGSPFRRYQPKPMPGNGSKPLTSFQRVER